MNEKSNVSIRGYFKGITCYRSKTLKTLKLSGIAIKATSVHDERPRTRTKLPASMGFHVTLTSVDSYRCDSHCLTRLFPNLPAPSKHYGVFDILLIRKVFAKAKNLGSHSAKPAMTHFHRKVNIFWQWFAKCEVNTARAI